ncbi:MAG: hypothetical protein JRI68_15635, partial [Deltaproteobacteria bacterium]|nr:hypothetical protein [Deltaproteobacteria bacterium]
FRETPAVVGLLIGVACALMVSFATLYRHVGRLVAQHPRVLLATPLAIGAVVLAGVLFGLHGSVALVLAAALAYGLLPVARAFVAAGRSAARGPSLPTG